MLKKVRNRFFTKSGKQLFKKYPKIILKVSIDPNESKESVIRRINFYIKNNYRVFDIEFRKKYGPIFSMFKNKKIKLNMLSWDLFSRL